MSEKVHLEPRVRFAPSPTGYLHVGGARTALYNWLFARGQNGVFILRIEDTDKDRSKEIYLSEILEDLKWLGLNWDEGPATDGAYGPYYQSQRQEIYNHFVQRLLDSGWAYHCFCTQKELENRTTFKYDGQCRNLSPDAVEKKLAAHTESIIRFRIPDQGVTEFKDIIKKRIRVENKQLDDFIIVRSDGSPTYNLTGVADDISMKITHVIRGDDHISNTPKQLLIYKALHEIPPQYAHIPMILGPDGSRLSKRHGATAIAAYRQMGFVPESMINYLAMLGWAYDDKQSIFEPQELIDKFSLTKVSKRAAIFDEQKLLWVNGIYLRKFSPDRFYSLCLPYLNKDGFTYLIDEETVRFNGMDIDKGYLKKVLSAVQGRIKKLDQIVRSISYFFEDTITYEEEAQLKLTENKKLTYSILLSLQKKLSMLKLFNICVIEESCNEAISQMGITLKDFVHPVRAAITGRTASPGLFETMELVGRDKVLLRIGQALKYIEFAAGSANGRPGDSGSLSPGSNPGPAAIDKK